MSDDITKVARPAGAGAKEEGRSGSGGASGGGRLDAMRPALREASYDEGAAMLATHGAAPALQLKANSESKAPPAPPTSASVVSIHPGDRSVSVVLTKGKAQGVTKGMPVALGGLLGKVTEVYEWRCKAYFDGATSEQVSGHSQAAMGTAAVAAASAEPKEEAPAAGKAKGKPKPVDADVEVDGQHLLFEVVLRDLQEAADLDDAALKKSAVAQLRAWANKRRALPNATHDWAKDELDALRDFARHVGPWPDFDKALGAAQSKLGKVSKEHRAAVAKRNAAREAR